MLEMNKRRQGLLGGGNEGRRESVNTIMNKMRNEEQINVYLIIEVHIPKIAISQLDNFTRV